MYGLNCSPVIGHSFPKEQQCLQTASKDGYSEVRSMRQDLKEG